MVKIIIKFGVLAVVLVVMFLAFNLFIRRGLEDEISKTEGSIRFQQTIGVGLTTMLGFKDKWPEIFKAQHRDIEFIRTILPEAPFDQKMYLQTLIHTFHESNVYSKGVTIRKPKPAAKKVNYFDFFTTDVVALAGYLESFKKAFDYLNEEITVGGVKKTKFDLLTVDQGASEKELELALWHSYQFNKKMSVDVPEGLQILSGMEIHQFMTTITGSYDDIKHFLWAVQNMRPHTVIVNWHLTPGKGGGEDRTYTASMTLVTFSDTNVPPSYEHSTDDPFYKLFYEKMPDMPNVSQVLAAVAPKM